MTPPYNCFDSRRESRLPQESINRSRYYSNRYNKIQQVGHTRAAPSFGAPALIWHMALWPERQSDPLQSRLDLPEAERRLEFERRNGAFIRIVQGFLDKLDSKGRNPKIPKSARER